MGSNSGWCLARGIMDPQTSACIYENISETCPCTVPLHKIGICCLGQCAHRPLLDKRHEYVGYIPRPTYSIPLKLFSAERPLSLRCFGENKIEALLSCILLQVSGVHLCVKYLPSCLSPSVFRTPLPMLPSQTQRNSF